jgi:hypothetical protein
MCVERPRNAAECSGFVVSCRYETGVPAVADRLMLHRTVGGTWSRLFYRNPIVDVIPGNDVCMYVV